MNIYGPAKLIHHLPVIQKIGVEPAAPVHIHLIVSDLCNQKCSFCAYRDEEYPSNQLFGIGEGAARNNNPNRMIPGPKVLEILSAVRPCRDRPFATLGRRVLEQSGALSGVICVLLGWDRARRELVDRLRALAVPTLVLVVTDPARPGRGAALPAAPVVHRLEVGRVGEGLMGLRT